MIRMVCLTSDEITDYLQGRLPEEESLSVEEHLSGCDQCEESVRSLDASGDSLIRHLRLSRNPPNEDGDWENCLDSLRELPDRVSDARTDDGPRESDGVPLEQMLRPESVYHYQLEQQLGRGGMGVVYRSWHPQLHRAVAIKILSASRSADAASISRFQREMRAAGGLDHQGIVRAVDAGVWQGTYFLVMELIDGVDLARIVHRCGPLSVADGCAMIVQAAEAVQFAHEKQIIHRDIKPSNLMLTREGVVKILDFGLARLEHGGLTSHDATTAGRLIGTLDYLAPEQAAGSGPVDSRSDVYGLGATLFRLLAGQAPHGSSQNRPILQFLQELVNEATPPLDHYREDLPKELCSIVSATLARDPSQRPASAGQLAELLRPWADGSQLSRLCDESIDAEAGGESPSEFGKGLGSTRSVQDEQQNERRDAQHVNAIGKPVRSRPAVHALIATACLLAGLLGGWAGLTMWLKTGDAYVRIDSEVDEITLELIKDGEVSERIEVHPGEKVSRVQVGRYELKIAGKSDSVRLDQASLLLMHGDERVVRITKQASPPSPITKTPVTPSPITKTPITEASASADFPDRADHGDMIEATAAAPSISSPADVERWLQAEGAKLESLRSQHGEDHPLVAEAKKDYVKAKKELVRIATGEDPSALTSKGRTYKQWTDIVLRETDPSTVVDAVSALASLSAPNTHEQTMETLIKIARWNEERGPDDLATAYISYLSNKKIDPQRQPRSSADRNAPPRDFDWERLFPRVEEDWRAVLDAIMDAIETLPMSQRNQALFTIHKSSETAKRVALLDVVRGSLFTGNVVTDALSQKDQQDDTRAVANYVWLAKLKQDPTDLQKESLVNGSVKLKKVILATLLKTKQYPFGREMGIAVGDLLGDEVAGFGGSIRELALRSITEWESFENTQEHQFLKSIAGEIVHHWEDRKGGLAGVLEGCEFIEMFAAANLIAPGDREAASRFLHAHLTRQLRARATIDDPSIYGESTMFILRVVQALANVDGKLPAELDEYAMKEGSKQAIAFAAWEKSFRDEANNTESKFSIWLIQFPLETTRVLFDVTAREFERRAVSTSQSDRFARAYGRIQVENEYLQQLQLSFEMPYALARLDDERVQRVFGIVLASKMNQQLDQVRLSVPLDKYASALLAATEAGKVPAVRGLTLRLSQVGGADPDAIREYAIKRIEEVEPVEDGKKPKWSASTNELSWLVDCLAHCEPNKLTDEQVKMINDRIVGSSFSSNGSSDMQRCVMASLKLCESGTTPDPRVVLVSLGVRLQDFRSSWNPSGRSRQVGSNSETMAWTRISGSAPTEVTKQVFATLAANPLGDEKVLDELLSKQRRLVSSRESESEAAKALANAIAAVRDAIKRAE